MQQTVGALAAGHMPAPNLPTNGKVELDVPEGHLQQA